MAFNPEYWKASKGQKEQIAQELNKLGFSLEDYGGGLTWENMLWHQAISIISGLEWLISSPNSWKKVIK